MNRRSRIYSGMFALLGASLAFSLACGSELTLDDAALAQLPDPALGAVELLRDPWCKPFAERFCAVADECHCSGQGGWPDDCVAAVERSCMLAFENQADALEDGFLVSTDNVAHCLELVDESLTQCDLPPADTFPAECTFIVPLGGVSFLRAGETCSFGSACGRGLRCSSLGTCRPPLPRGGHCLGTGDCQPGLECDFSSATCQPPVRVGVGAFCSNQFQGCQGNLVCGMSSRLSCQGPDVEGLCRFSEECEPNGFCDSDSRCHPRPLRGEPCINGFICGAGLACDTVTNTCKSLPKDGEACLFDEVGQRVCAPGLACSDFLCAPAPRLGETCNFGFGNECAEGLVCIQTSDGFTECGLPSGVDDPCFSDLTCAPGLLCDFNNTQTCQRAPKEGERCDKMRCTSPFECVPVEPGDRRCALVNSLGDPCINGCPSPLGCLPDFTEGVCVTQMCMSVSF